MAAARVAEMMKEQNREVEKWAVLPRPLGSARIWEVIISSKSGVSMMDICTVPCPGIEKNMIPILASAPRSEVVTRASTTESAAALLRFARFPVTRIEELPSGYRVTLIESRFYRPDVKRALAAEITLDQSLQVVRENLSFDQSVK